MYIWSTSHGVQSLIDPAVGKTNLKSLS